MATAKISTFVEVYSPGGKPLDGIQYEFGKPEQVRHLINMIYAEIAAATAVLEINGDDPKELLINLIKTRRQISCDEEKFDKMIETFLSPENLAFYKDITKDAVEIPNPEANEGTYGIISDHRKELISKITDPNIKKAVENWERLMVNSMVESLQNSPLFFGVNSDQKPTEGSGGVSVIPIEGSEFTQGGGGKAPVGYVTAKVGNMKRAADRKESAMERARRILEERREKGLIPVPAPKPQIEDKKLAPFIEKAEKIVLGTKGTLVNTKDKPRTFSSLILAALAMAMVGGTNETSAPVAPLLRSGSDSLTPTIAPAGAVAAFGETPASYTGFNSGSGLQFHRNMLASFSGIGKLLEAAKATGWVPPPKPAESDFSIILKNAEKPLSDFLYAHPELRMKILTLAIEQFARFYTSGPVTKIEFSELWMAGLLEELKALGDSPEMDTYIALFSTVTPVPIALPSMAPPPPPPVVGEYTPQEEKAAKAFVIGDYPFTKYVAENPDLIEELRKQGINNMTSHSGENIEPIATYAGLSKEDQTDVDAGVDAVMNRLYVKEVVPTLVTAYLKAEHQKKLNAHPRLVVEHTIAETSRVNKEWGELKAASLDAAEKINSEIIKMRATAFREANDKYTAQVKDLMLSKNGANITVIDFRERVSPSIISGNTTVLASYIVREELTSSEEWKDYFSGTPIIYPGLRFDLLNKTDGVRNTVQFDLRDTTHLNALKPMFVHFYCNDMAEKPDLYKTMVCAYLDQLEEIDVISIALLGLSGVAIKEPGIAALVDARNKVTGLFINYGIFGIMNYTNSIAGSAYEHVMANTQNGVGFMSIGGSILKSISMGGEVTTTEKPRELVEYGVHVVEFENKQPTHERAVAIIVELQEAVEEFNPDSVAVEASKLSIIVAKKLLNTSANVAIGVLNITDNVVEGSVKMSTWLNLNFKLGFWIAGGAILGAAAYANSKGQSRGSGCCCSNYSPIAMARECGAGCIKCSTAIGVGAVAGFLTGAGFESYPVPTGVMIAGLAIVVAIPLLKKLQAKLAALISDDASAAAAGTGAPAAGTGAVAAPPGGVAAPAAGTGAVAAPAGGLQPVVAPPAAVAQPLGGAGGPQPAAGSGGSPARLPPLLPTPPGPPSGPPSGPPRSSLLGPGPGPAPAPRGRAASGSRRGGGAGAGQEKHGGYRMTGKNKRRTGKSKNRRRLTRRKNRQ
jgi:hypothetical protein